jgi:ATP-dependent Clp protease ATP-binding subunit ClpA
MNELLSDKHICVSLTDSAVEFIIKEGYDSKMGARPLARKINELVKVPLSKKILFDSLHNCDVKVDYQDKISFAITEKEFIVFPANKIIDENGYVILDQIKSNC